MKRKKAVVKYNCFFCTFLFYLEYIKALTIREMNITMGLNQALASIIVNILPVVVIGSMTSFLTRFLRYN